MLKKSSIIFLLILFVVLVFIVGVRRGQQVEKTNKVINYLISIPPTATLQPTQPKLEFQTYNHSDCKLQFLYPSFLKKEGTSSTSAKFSGNYQSIEFDCSRNSANLMPNDEKMATLEVKLNNKVVKARVKPTAETAADAGPTLFFTTANPRTGRNVFFAVSKSLFPLFEKSLEFVP